MKNVVRVLGLAVKYASYITIFIEIVQFAKDKIEPLTENKTVKK